MRAVVGRLGRLLFVTGVVGVLTTAGEAAAQPVVNHLAVSVAGDRATASWSPGGPDVLYYRVEFVSAVPGAPIGWTHTRQTAIAAVVSPGTYWVRAAAATLAGLGPFSAPVAFVAGGTAALPVPVAPRDLLATQDGTRVVLRWNGSADDVVTSHRIELGSAPGLHDLGTFDTGTPMRLAAAPLPAGAYWVRVRAGNAAGYGAPSADLPFTVSATVACLTPPAAPSMPEVLLANTGGGRSATLTWTMPGATSAPTAYVVELGSASGLADIAAVDVPPVSSVSGPILPGRFYFLRLRARNACGLGPASAEVSFWVF